MRSLTRFDYSMARSGKALDNYYYVPFYNVYFEIPACVITNFAYTKLENLSKVDHNLSLGEEDPNRT
jgi:hypothetical protein